MSLKKYFLMSSVCGLSACTLKPLDSAKNFPATKPAILVQEDAAPVPSRRQVAQAEKSKVLCDLSADRCSAKPLTTSQLAKTVFLTDLVAEKILELETAEKNAGRDLKVVFLSRMGSNLEKFQPLKDTDKAGKSMSSSQIIEKLMQESVTIDQPQPNAIQYQAMYQQFDRSRKMKYSHMGIAIKNMPLTNKSGVVVTQADKGYWTVVHLLYSCEENKRSYIYKGTLANFFYDHMADYGAQVIVPNQELQNNIEQILVKDYLGKNWIEKQYNAIALPTDLDEQNSNQWVLEVIAAALYPPGQIKNREEAQAILRQTDYRTTKVTPTGLYSALRVPVVAKIVSNIMPTVCLGSQPNIRNHGVGEIISALSLQEYLARNKRLQSEHEVELTPQDKKELDNTLNPPKATSLDSQYSN